MSSISSCGSTASSKARASAKKAALKVRLQRLAEMEQLEQAELKLKQQKCRFEQETALAEAEAEEQVYESLEADPLDDATSEIKQAASPPLLSDPWWSGQPLQSSNLFDTPPEEINRTLPPPVVPITSSSLAVTHSNPQPSPAIQLADPTSQPFPVSQPSSFKPETSAVHQPVHPNQQPSPVIQPADPTLQASPVNRPAHLNPQSPPVSQSVDSNLTPSPVSQPVHPSPQASPFSANQRLQQQPVNIMSEMGNIMFRKELLALSLRGFNDSTPMYRTWKASIVSSVKELNIPPSQELNLVMKWLGNDSRKLVEPLYSVYIDQPAEALKQIWSLLDDTYGSPEAIESNVMTRLQEFPKLSAKESSKLLQLDHLLLEVLHLKKSGKYPGLASLDSAHGINPIVQKLPPGLQDKWMKHGSKYKSSNARLFPPFEVFHGFIHSEAKMRNDPSFLVCRPCTASESNVTSDKVKSIKPVSVWKTEVINATNPREEDLQMCVLHNSQHPLHECRFFRKKPLLERKQLLKELGVCYKCCMTWKHVARNCKNPIKCEDCGSDRHVTALHIRIPPRLSQEQSGSKGADIQAGSSTEITNACTDLCSSFPRGKSCAKICKVEVYREDQQEQTVPAYAVIDDQSNTTLAKGELFDLLGISSPPTTYAMKTCAGSIEVTGRDTTKLWIKSTDGRTCIKLPSVRECVMIPDKLEEIPSPEVARHHLHLQRIANEIEPIDPAIPILLLIGRDVLQAHKVREQINGPDNAPYAQRLDLGWVIVGDACLDGLHKKVGISVHNTGLLDNTGRQSTVFEPSRSSRQVCDF
ncbi:uncharacterized protein LOC119735847 [Patiria miniata]|uniref:Uncharacterized protein n=1 Tax=Patiria miniata TaxID=46514 RepID=A0A914AQJ6_PATMI|nr:uncharacterized protein LOC119735847 [Patiria miniata]